MKRLFTATGISFRIWLLTSILLAMGIACFVSLKDTTASALTAFFGSFVISLIAGIPAPIVILLALPGMNSTDTHHVNKNRYLLILILFITAGYGLIPAVFGIPLFGSETRYNFFTQWFISSIMLFSCCFFSVIILAPQLLAFFSNGEFSSLPFAQSLSRLFFKTNTNTIMEPSFTQGRAPAQSNRLLFKGLITGGLILLMLIPTFFIQNLVTERQARQMEVVKEVSSKWAGEQTLSGPFLVVPYHETITGSDGKQLNAKTNLIISADHLLMNGKIIPEERPRSIYKVLLYKAALDFSGSFKPQWPADINPDGLDATNAKLCFSLSDYKGIEEEVSINFNGQKLLLNPGLPVNDVGETGLSVPVKLDTASLNTGISFNMQLRVKGSGQLHFIPMSINSRYVLSSTWPDPSFDGNALPTEREVKDSGFVSQWNFNRANLSFGAVVKEGLLKPEGNAFGVSLVQPADQYNKTMRSVKYAILIIGLSFALFFIIEIMQKKPFHPVQYVLVGLALVIFYTLLLSISEFILFDHAYLVAASATVLLIFFYAKSHFGNWRSASVLGAALSGLYGFVFILIRLEDTALLVGSIGLFIILASVMYASRKINWYSKIEH